MTTTSAADGTMQASLRRTCTAPAPAPAQASSSSSATQVTDNISDSNEAEVSSPAEATIMPARSRDEAGAASTSSGYQSSPARPQQDWLNCEGLEDLNTDIEHVRSTTQHHWMLKQLVMPTIEAFGNDLAPFSELQRILQAYAEWLPDFQTAVEQHAAQQRYSDERV